MTILEFAARMRVFIEDLNASREEESVLIGHELAAQVRTRVQTQKVNAEGQPFGNYSTAKVPQWFFYNKALNGGSLNRIKKGPWFISYEEFRTLNGRPVDAVNFSFSGDMWENTGVTEVQSDGDAAIVKIGGQTSRAANIQEWQAPRYGNILEANEEEINRVKIAHENRIINKFKKYFQ